MPAETPLAAILAALPEAEREAHRLARLICLEIGENPDAMTAKFSLIGEEWMETPLRRNWRHRLERAQELLAEQRALARLRSSAPVTEGGPHA
jgi:hypothetical protein